MSIAPPPAPTYPYPPAPHNARRRWRALAAAAAIGAVTAGSITTLVAFAVTSPTSTSVTSAPSTVTETAAPPAPPAPLPAADADAQTCRAYENAETLATAAAAAQGAIPQGMTITDPAVPGNPAWKASVMRASDLYGQAADNLEQGMAAGTSQILADTAQTTASSLHALGESYSVFAPENGAAMAAYQDSKTAMQWLCRLATTLSESTQRSLRGTHNARQVIRLCPRHPDIHLRHLGTLRFRRQGSRFLVTDGRPGGR